MPSATTPECETTDAAPGEQLAPSVQLALTEGLSEGAKLRKSRIFELTQTGVEFSGEPTFEQWREGLHMLKMAKSSLQVWLADFLSHGRKAFGEAAVQEALVQLEFPQMDVNQALGIAALNPAVRNVALTSEHYWVLARRELKTVEQERWANLAVLHKLSALQLARSIAEGKVVKESGGPLNRAGGVPTIQGFRQLFDTWFHQVDARDPIQDWPTERKRELWEELKGPVQVGLQIARELGLDPAGLSTAKGGN